MLNSVSSQASTYFSCPYHGKQIALAAIIVCIHTTQLFGILAYTLFQMKYEHVFQAHYLIYSENFKFEDK